MHPPFRGCGFQSIRAGCLCARQHERHTVLAASWIGRHVLVGLLLAVAPFVHGRSFGQLVRSWPASTTSGQTRWVHSVAFSPDSNIVASGAYDGSVRLWDVATGANTARLWGRTHAGHSVGLSVAFSPDGNMLASGDFDKTVRLWDVATGANTATLKHYTPVNSVAFSADGNMLASGTSGNSVELWDVATGANTATLRHNKNIHPRFDHHYWVYSVAFSPDGNMLASGGDNGIFKLWDVATGASTATLSGHTGHVRSVAFSPDGGIVASVSRDQTVRLWDVATGSNTRTLWGHTGNVNTVAFSPDGNMLASGASDHTIRLWDVATGATITTLSRHTDHVHSVAFSPDGNMLASGAKDGYINLWDVSDITPGEIPMAFQLHGNYPIRSIRPRAWYSTCRRQPK